MLVLVTSKPKTRTALVNGLLENGIYSYVTAPSAAMQLIRDKDTGGVILDGCSDLTSCELLCASLREAYPPIPIAAIVAPSAIPHMEADCFLRAQTDEELLDGALEFCRVPCKWNTNRLSTPFLTVGNAPEETLYMGYRLCPSPQEHRILHFLFYRAPACTFSNDLLTLCFPFSQKSKKELSVLIARINKRAIGIDSRALIIHQKDGYRLREGILTTPDTSLSIQHSHIRKG